MAQRPNKWLDPTKTRIIILVDCDVVACGSSRVNHRSLDGNPSAADHTEQVNDYAED
jgi:hypothetical protein